MARVGRPDDEFSVDELLRETGAMPRSLEAYVPITRAREDDTDEGYRERLEQRAREAAAAQQRAGRRIRWVSALCGAIVVIGSLVIITVTSESSPGRQAAVAADPLAPATTSRTVTTAASSPTPVPTVIRQTSSAPASTAPKTTAGSTSPTQAPPPPPPAPVASCSVRYDITDQWPNGFTANVYVTNTGNQTLNPWTATWNFTAGQQVTHSWNGDFSQSGSRVTMKAVSYNLSMAPGTTIDIGFNGSFSRDNPAAVGFTLNGARCKTS
ncbi:cellulose-binding domain-containing protein [Streptomyces sp. MN03-5084-2B]|nr:cellulose-binding domain-containing protein [Streptomyces sp. MN03-5084-2B]